MLWRCLDCNYADGKIVAIHALPSYQLVCVYIVE